MPLDRDIRTGYTKSWERQRPRFKVNDSDDVTNALHRRFNEKQRQRESENIARAVGQKDGNYFFRDRRGDEKTGIVAQFLNSITGRGKADEARQKMLSLAKSGAYYPPRSVNTSGLWAGDNYNYPEAKEVVPKYTYGGRDYNPWAAYYGDEKPNINEELIEQEMAMYGGSPSRKAFYDYMKPHYAPGSGIAEEGGAQGTNFPSAGYGSEAYEADPSYKNYWESLGGIYGPGGRMEGYGGLEIEQQMTDVPAVDITGKRIEDDEGYNVHTTGPGIQYFPEIGDYYKGSQAGAGYDISYPDPNMIYGTGDYGQVPYEEMLGRNMGRMGRKYFKPTGRRVSQGIIGGRNRGGIASLKYAR